MVACRKSKRGKVYLMSDYIKWIRSKVGNDIIILNFSGACITNENGELLLQKRSDKEDIWGLPGGAVEIGESIEESAIREVKEETGIDIRDRKSTRLNSSHANISYAVFCLKKKIKLPTPTTP